MRSCSATTFTPEHSLLPTCDKWKSQARLFPCSKCTIARHRAQASWGLPRELKTSVKLQGCTSPVQKRTRVSLSNAPRSGLSKKQSSAYVPSLMQAPSSSSSSFISIHRGFSRVLSIKHQWLHINNPYQVLSRPEQLLCCFLKKILKAEAVMELRIANAQALKS